jgi:hypothetical protein
LSLIVSLRRVTDLLLDTLEKVNLDARTLVHLLDERPSVVRVLMDGETEGLPMERMVDYLERLHERR